MTLDLKDRLYTSSEVAEILGVSLRSVYRYIEEGKLDADIKTATGRHRFSRKNILDFLKPGESQNNYDNSMNSVSSQNQNPYQNTVIQTNSKDDFDFDFDFDDEFLRSLDSTQPKNNDSSTIESNSGFTSNKNFNSNYIPQRNSGSDTNESLESMLNDTKTDELDDLDDLEKLLREFEEEEIKKINDFKREDMAPNDPISFMNSNTNNSYFRNNNSNNSRSFEDDDLSLDEILKSFESDDINNFDSTSSNSQENVAKKSENKNDDFDFDFDFDDLDSFFDEKPKQSPQVRDDSGQSNSYYTSNNVSNNSSYQAPEVKSFPYQESKADEEDNWLERFRKAASKNSQIETNNNPVQNSKNFQDEVFFRNNDYTSNQNISNFEIDTPTDLKEVYYTSSLNDLREIAQQVDKIAKKFDTDYAFTLNAGLSLHKKIEPFNIIHLYIRDRDLELFEDYLDLTPASKSDSSVCLMVTKQGSVFEDAYELHGLYVVSNVQLRSDLIDKGLDKLAREI